MENELLESVTAATSAKTLAVGNDLVFIPGFEMSLNELFKKKVFTDGEIAYCDQFKPSLVRYASTWAAKEAVYKALKQINAAFAGWKNIEILRDRPSGKPTVRLPHTEQINHISLTISHDGDYAWAVAVIEKALTA